MGRLITPSIMNAVDWAKNAPTSIIRPEKGGDGKTTWRARAFEDLTRQLSRCYSDEMPEPVKRGLDFEDAVYRRARMPEDSWKGSKEFGEIVSEARGGRFQVKTKRDITVDGIRYTCFGKLDIRHPKLIIDLKTTNKYKEPQKYLSTPQHLIYTWSERIPDFRYRVVVLDEKNRILEHYPVDFHSPGEAEVEAELTRRIRSFREYLEIEGLLDLYNEKFCLY